MSKVKIVGADLRIITYKNGEVLDIVPTSEVYKDADQAAESDELGIWVRCRQPGDFFGTPVFVEHKCYILATGDKIVTKPMKTWVEMTERERDVLVCQTLGYIPAKLNWWFNPNKDFNCDPNEAQEWLREGTDRYAGRGVEYKGNDERFKGKKFLLPSVTSRFSTDRAAAMGLLDGCRHYQLEKDYNTGRFDCVVTLDFHEYKAFDCNTEAEAICRAFLRAKGINIE